MTKKAESKDTFWDDARIPYQDDDSTFDFANPVVVSEQFIRAVSQAAQVGSEAEALYDELGALTDKKTVVAKKLRRLNRELLSQNYTQVTKTASPDVMAAFIQLKAREAGRETELVALIDEQDQIEEKIDRVEHRLDKFRRRMRFLERSMDWAKQYLDYDKMLERLEGNARSTR